jgi:hypothetical protein
MKGNMHILKNQIGASIILISVAIAIVGAGTAVIYNMTKDNTVSAAKSKTTTLMELEKRRISGILSNNEICKLATNLGGKPDVQASIAELKANALGQRLVAIGDVIFNRQLRVTNIATVIKTAGSAKGYELVITYGQPLSSTGMSFVGKKQAQIKIPLYQFVSGGVVTDCFTMSENSVVDSAISNACSPSKYLTANGLNYLSKTADGVISGCNTEIIFDTNYPGNNPYTSCSGTLFMNGLTTNTILTNGRALKFTSSFCNNMTGTGSTVSCPAYQGAYQLTASGGVNCQYPGVTRDSDGGSALCGSGQVLYRTGASSTTCVTVSCGANSYVNSITSGGAPCTNVPVLTCPAGQYVTGFNASGTPTCADLPVWSGNCAGAAFATGVSRSAGAGGSLICGTFNIGKSCPGGASVFMSSMDATTVGCTTF